MPNELGEAQKKAWAALLISHAYLTRQLDRELVARGCPCLAVYDVLLALEDAPDHKLRMSDLADQVVFDASSLTRMVDRLVKEGYVARENHPTDRRSVYAVLTPMGQKVREMAWPTYRELIETHFGQHITAVEAESMATALRRIAPCKRH